MKTMPAEPQYLRATVVGRPVKVDREKEILYGYVVAQEGPFKSQGRGEFDELSLRQIVQLGNAARGGLKSRFTHPDMSSDGLGKLLGRAKNFTMSTTVNAAGKSVRAVRADLHFDPSAHETPSGDLSGYVMKLAETDPDAISSSIVVVPEQEFRRKKDGTLETDANGDPLPPLWRPKQLHASDIVDTGDAVDGLLSAPALSAGLAGGDVPPELLRWDNVVRLSGRMLDGLFEGQPRDVVEARCREYLDRYLSRRFGPSLEEAPTVQLAPAPTPRLDKIAGRLRALAAKR